MYEGRRIKFAIFDEVSLLALAGNVCYCAGELLFFCADERPAGWRKASFAISAIKLARQAKPADSGLSLRALGKGDGRLEALRSRLGAVREESRLVWKARRLLWSVAAFGHNPPFNFSLEVP